MNEIQNGSVLACYAARSKNVYVRLNSASGGVFFELAEQTIKHGGVVFGCALDAKQENACHIEAQTVEALSKICGSKYLQSELNDSFYKVKCYVESGRKVLFSGTPCQIAGLRRYIGCHHHNLFCVEIVCHGVGSPEIYKRYLSELGKPIDTVSFRKKLSSRGSFFCVKFTDGTEHIHPAYSQGYDYAYNQGLIHRPSCRTCSLRGSKSYADLTIGDFWGSGQFVPEWSNAGGVSVVIAHTDVGLELIRKSKIELHEVTFNQASHANASLLEPFDAGIERRIRFVELMKSNTVTESVHILQQENEPQRIVKFAVWVKHFAGKILRDVGIRKLNVNNKIRNVGIYTISRNFLLTNYGSFFQHYALRQMLKRMGYRPFRIERHAEIGELLDLLLPIRIVRTRFLSFVRNEHFHINGLGRRFYRRRLSFLLDYIHLIGRIAERQKTTRFYICGGDCIWSQANRDAFLLGQPNDAIKVSYAVSAKWESCAKNGNWRNLLIQAAKMFAGLGVREKFGCDVCNEIIGMNIAIRVLDPVLLLKKDDYCRIAARPSAWPDNALFSYLVNIHNSEDLCIKSFKNLSKSIGCDLKILGIQGVQDLLNRKTSIELRPTEFLGAMRDCQYFITNSFHGIAFALLFEKQFVFVRQKIDGQNLRQLSMLEMVGLTDRAIEICDLETDGLDLLNRKIDWACVRKVIESERFQSVDWLGRVLEGD